MTDDLEAMGAVDVTARRSQSPSSDGLVRAYERCLREFIRSDSSTPISLPRVRRSTTAAHAAVLLVDPKGKNELDWTSYFLSLMYLRTRERVITYDLPLPLDMLGTLIDGESRPNTVLVNHGTIGTDVGADLGFVVNAGIAPPPRCHSLYIDLSSCVATKRYVDEVLPNALYVNPARGVVRGCAVLESCVLPCSLYAPSPDELAEDTAATPIAIFPDKDLRCTGYMSWGASELRRYRKRLRYRPNAGQNLVSWLSEIGELAAKRPEELPARYNKGARWPANDAKTELLALLFENWGDIR